MAIDSLLEAAKDLPTYTVIPPNRRIRTSDLELPDGSPLVGPDGLLIPQARSFTTILNSATRVYSYRFDEAMRDNQVNARAMRRDAFIRGLLEERILPTINRKWQLEVDDDRNSEQVYVRDALTRVLDNIHDFDEFKRALLDAVWFGRAGCQWSYKRDPENNNLWGLGKWDPVHGDSVQFTFDGVPAVLMDGMASGWYSSHGAKTGVGGDIRPTDRGGQALVLQRPYWRDRFAIHTHMKEKADFFEGELAGSVQGLGLRGLVYWHYIIRSDALTWMLGYMQAVGQMDLLVFNYPAGDAAAKLNQENNARKIIGKAAIACPRNPTQNWPAVEQIPMNEAGLRALHDLIADYFDRHIERLIVGQSMSSGADHGDGLGGTGRADFAKSTKDEILVYDTGRLDNTLTQDLIKPLKRYNFPWATFPVKFTSVMPDLEGSERLQAGTTLVSVGVAVKVDELREAAGYSRPEAGDETVGGPPPMPPPGMMAGPEMAPPGAVPPPDGGMGPVPAQGPAPFGPQANMETPGLMTAAYHIPGMGPAAAKALPGKEVKYTGTPTPLAGTSRYMGCPGGGNTYIPTFGTPANPKLIPGAIRLTRGASPGQFARDTSPTRYGGILAPASTFHDLVHTHLVALDSGDFSANEIHPAILSDRLEDVGDPRADMLRRAKSGEWFWSGKTGHHLRDQVNLHGDHGHMILNAVGKNPYRPNAKTAKLVMSLGFPAHPDVSPNRGIYRDVEVSPDEAWRVVNKLPYDEIGCYGADFLVSHGFPRPPEEPERSGEAGQAGPIGPDRFARGGQLTTYKSGPHKFACVMARLTGEAAIKILNLASLVRDEDLAPDGREDSPHLTLLYGLHGDDPKPVAELLAHAHPIRFTLGKVSCFESVEHDVLKVEVEDATQVRELNTLLKTLPYTSKYPNYDPHVTIGYLKPGLGAKYAAAFGRLGIPVTCTAVEYSPPEGDKVFIELTSGAGVDARQANRRYVRGEAAIPYASGLLPREAWQAHIDQMRQSRVGRSGQPFHVVHGHERGVLADRMADAGDPREEILRRAMLPEEQHIPELGPHSTPYWPVARDAEHGHDPNSLVVSRQLDPARQQHRVRLPDGSELSAYLRTHEPHNQTHTATAPSHVNLSWSPWTSDRRQPMVTQANFLPEEAHQIVSRLPEPAASGLRGYLQEHFPHLGGGDPPPEREGGPGPLNPDRFSSPRTPTRYARTIHSTDPSLRNWWSQAVQNGNAYQIDHTVAGAMGDWLEENGDWRHWLTRRLADPSEKDRQTGATMFWQRPDGLTVDNARHRQAGSYHALPVRHDPESGHGQDSNPAGYGAVSRVTWSHTPENSPVVFLHTTLPADERHTRFAFSILTPDEYAGMREEAATAGVNFPAPPQSHDPAAQQNSPPSVPPDAIDHNVPMGRPANMSRYAGEVPQPIAHHAPAGPEHFQSPAHFGEFLAGAHAAVPGLHPEEVGRRQDAARRVAGNLTPYALGRLADTVKGVRAHPHSGSVGDTYRAEIDPNDKDDGILGFVDNHRGVLHIDGGDADPGRDKTGQPETDHAGVYSHELAHMIDRGRDGMGDYRRWLSGNPSFQSAFNAEIKGGNLSDYATLSPREGFAEFFRLLHGSELPRHEAHRRFPKTYAFFATRGLV